MSLPLSVCAVGSKERVVPCHECLATSASNPCDPSRTARTNAPLSNEISELRQLNGVFANAFMEEQGNKERLQEKCSEMQGVIGRLGDKIRKLEEENRSLENENGLLKRQIYRLSRPVTGQQQRPASSSSCPPLQNRVQSSGDRGRSMTYPLQSKEETAPFDTISKLHNTEYVIASLEDENRSLEDENGLLRRQIYHLSQPVIRQQRPVPSSSCPPLQNRVQSSGGRGRSITYPVQQNSAAVVKKPVHEEELWRFFEERCLLGTQSQANLRPLPPPFTPKPYQENPR